MVEGSARAGVRTTLADVAERAGTSVPTVSKVLRGRSDVSARTRQVVMAAVEATGYSSRNGARLRDPAAALIDFVLSDVHGSWVSEALGGVEGAATAAAHDVVLTIAREDGAWVERVLRHRSAGAVIALVDPTRVQLEVLRAAGRRFVLMDPMSRAPSFAASVGVSNWTGGRSAAEHLVDQGHRRVAAIGGGRTHLYSQARLDGFRSGIESAPGGRVIAVEWADWRRPGAREAAARILRLPDPPTAVFACSDLMAIGVVDAARDLGLRVPDDLSVVGFDDLPEAGWTTPPLTTVRQPISDLGAAAVRLLLRMSGAGADPAPREELATGLVVRGSTAPAPAGPAPQQAE